MENFYFKNRAEYSDYLSEHVVERLGEPGEDGQCFLLDNGMVVKNLYHPLLPDFALQFKDFDYESFIFAKSGAFIGDEVSALFMDYAPGKLLKEDNAGNQGIKILGRQLQVLSNDIVSASERGMLARDFKISNIVYDGLVFRIIDTTRYFLIPHAIYTKENFIEIMTRIYDCILARIVKDKRLNDRFAYWGNIDCFEYPALYLRELKKCIQEIVEHEVNTLNEAEQALKLKR